MGPKSPWLTGSSLEMLKLPKCALIQEFPVGFMEREETGEEIPALRRP